VHHTLLPVLMEIPQRGSQAKDNLVPMYIYVPYKSISGW
jgi:hypothetical protein